MRLLCPKCNNGSKRGSVRVFLKGVYSTARRVNTHYVRIPYAHCPKCKAFFKVDMLDLKRKEAHIVRLEFFRDTDIKMMSEINTKKCEEK